MNQNELLSALQAALSAENVAETEQLARTAVEQFPNEAWGYYFLAEANVLKPNFDNAELCLAKAIELDEENNDYRLRFAALKEIQGDYDDVEALYLIILDKTPAEPRALMGLSRYYLYHLHDEERALEYINQALEAEPNSALLHCLRAHALLIAEKTEEALAACDTSLGIEESQEALVLKINALEVLHRAEALPAAYEHLLSIAPRNADYIWQYANFLGTQNQWEAAEKQLRLLLPIEEFPQTPVLEALADVLEQQQKFADAIEIVSQWTALAPQEWLPFARRAHLHALAGDSNAALQDLKTATQYVTEASKADLLLQQARILLNLNDLREAGRLFQQASKDEVHAAEGFYGMGLVFYKAKSMDKAAEMMRQAVSLGHTEAENFLEKELAEQTAQNQQKVLAQYATEIAKNQQSSILQPLFGKVWRFAAALNPAPAHIPEDIVKKMQSSVVDTALIITPKGMVVINPVTRKGQLATYKIESATDKDITIEIAAFDGSTPYSATLQLNDKGALGFKMKGSRGEPLFLQASTAEKEKALLAKYFKPNALDFLN